MKIKLIRWVCLVAVLVSSSSVAMAAKEVFQRSKPHVNVGIIGHFDQGPTSLTVALGAATETPVRTTVICVNSSETSKIEALTADVETERAQYHIHDFSAEGTVADLATVVLPLDGAILVVSALDGLKEQTLEQVLLACLAGVPPMVVFIDQADQVADARQLDRVERDVRNVLSSCWIPGETIPIIRGSALKAQTGELETAAVLAELLDALDASVPTNDALD